MTQRRARRFSIDRHCPVAFLAINLSCIFFCGPSAIAQPSAEVGAAVNVTALPLTTARVIYDWSKEHCEDWDVPDAPLRAFRNAKNQVVAFVSDDNSRMFLGPKLDAVKHTCHSAYTSKKDSDPAKFDDLRYVTATWTTDGRHVISLTHSEYHAEQFSGRCRFSESTSCWYNAIVGMKSRDGGYSFETPPDLPLIAVPAFKQDVEQGRHRGFFNPSNIVSSGGYWFALINTTGGGGQQSGTCLFRSTDVADLHSWKAYDGEGFSAQVMNPYKTDEPQRVPCQRLPLHGVAGSVSYHAPTRSFIAVYQTGSDAKYPNARIAYQWSRDLIHWSEDQTLLDVPIFSGGNDCTIPLRYGYPSIADPRSTSRNFDTISSMPLLFLTRFHTSKCALPPNRDLIALPLVITGSLGKLAASN